MGKFLVRWLFPGSQHSLDAIMTEADAKAAVQRVKETLIANGHTGVESGYDDVQRRYYALSPLGGVGVIAQQLTGEELQAILGKFDRRLPGAPTPPMAARVPSPWANNSGY